MSTIGGLFAAIIPTKLETVLFVSGGAVGVWLSKAVGGFDSGVQWLFAFMVLDYLTGVCAAFKAGQLCAGRGLEGVLKKAFGCLIVTICHGMDTVMHDVDFLRDACVIALAANESFSIMKNVDRMGFGGIIPAPIRQAIKAIKERQDQNNSEGEE